VMLQKGTPIRDSSIGDLGKCRCGWRARGNVDHVDLRFEGQEVDRDMK